VTIFKYFGTTTTNETDIHKEDEADSITGMLATIPISYLKS